MGDPNISKQFAQIGTGHLSLPQLPEIPRRRYTDEAFYQAEMTHVWRKSWLLVGHVSEFEKAGSYRLLDVPFAPVFLVRGKDDKIRAFLNSCRHRGATVLREQSGNARVLSCQYHGWTYDFEGKLIGVPEQESFPGLNPENYSLESIRCELWGGFIYINFDKNAPALLDWLSSAVKQRYSEMTAAPMRVISKQYWDLNCNWKIAVEAFRESYHVPTIHGPTAAQVLDGPKSYFEMYRNGHGTMISPYWPNLMEREGWKGGVSDDKSAPPLPGTQTEEFAKHALMLYMFPNSFFGIQLIGFPAVTKWPLGPDRTRLEVVWYGVDWGQGPRPKEWDMVTAGFTMLVEEDIANMASIQESVEADAGKGVPLATQECLLYQLHAEIDRLIGSANIPADLRVPAEVIADYIAP